MEAGVDGLLRDKTRPSRIPRLGPEVVERVVALTLTDPPTETTHWTGRPDGAHQRDQRECGPSRLEGAWPPAAPVTPVQAIERSKIRRQSSDMVGLYLNPPDKAVVLCVDEKSQIQALDRTQPGLPMKKGRAQTMTHDLYGNGDVKG